MASLSDKIVFNINRLINEGQVESQAALARLVEMDPAQFNKILKGKQKFPLWLAEKIADKIGRPVEEFLGAISVPPQPRKPTPEEFTAAFIESQGLDKRRKAMALFALTSETTLFNAVYGSVKTFLPVVEESAADNKKSTGG